MSFILSLDQGTTSSRAMIFDTKGQVKAIAQKEFKQIFPKSGWVEHDPLEIWSSQIGVTSEVLAKSGISAKEIAGIGITNQRETTIVWDKKTSTPLYNAIVWQDRRTTDFCQKMKSEGLEKSIQKKTGLLIDPYFSATKIRWILENVPGAKEKAKRGELAFGTVDSWLTWKLTEGKCHITDVTNASRTMLFNIHTCEWDNELLDIFDIPASMLPNVCSSSEIYGKASTSILSAPIPICAIAGDQQAALFGQGCVKEGMVKVTYGTGSFMLLNTGNTPVLSENKLLTTVACKVKGKMNYALEGSLFVAGAVIQWLRDNLGIIKSSSEVDALAATVKDTEGVFFVPAFTGLGAPYWNPYTRGTMLGVTRGTKNAHIARAALESIAFQVADVIFAMQQDSKISIKEIRTDGGAAHSDLLMQFQSDLLRVNVTRPKITELTALGAAYLAGIAVGIWKDENEIATFWEKDHRFAPEEDKDKMDALYSKWLKAVKVAQYWEEK